jgi:hypothetical protein
MEALTVIAALVSALAAAGALWFAFETVEETRGLRREDRLARVAELIGELGAMWLRIESGADTFRNVYPVAQQRFRAAITTSGEQLPRCVELVEVELPKSHDPQQTETPEQVKARIEAALDELTPLIVAAREATSPLSTPAA